MNFKDKKNGTYFFNLQIHQTTNNDEIVGRINLVNIEKQIFSRAELEYRIGEIHQGKGYATKAVTLVLENLKKTHKINRVDAGTSIDNIPSQIVLVKNGFKFVGIQEKYILIKNKWPDNIIFQKIIT